MTPGNKGSPKLKTVKKDRIPVWIIDDNKSFCVVLSQALNQSDSVECTRYFHSSGAATQSLAEGDQLPSVILLDIKMPRLSGLDALATIRRLSPATHIIMLTSYDLDENIRTAMNRGASGYLLKSSAPEEIIGAVKNAKRGGAPLDAMITKRILGSYLGKSQEDRYGLTKREKEILQQVTQGLTTFQIAQALNMSYYTADTHLKNIFHKLNVHNRHGLVAKANRERLV